MTKITKESIREMDTANLVHYASKYRTENPSSVISAWLDDEQAERGNSANYRNNPKLKEFGCYQDY